MRQAIENDHAKTQRLASDLIQSDPQYGGNLIQSGSRLRKSNSKLVQSVCRPLILTMS